MCLSVYVFMFMYLAKLIWEIFLCVQVFTFMYVECVYNEYSK